MTDQDGGSSGTCQCEPCRERAHRLRTRAVERLKRLDLTKPPAPILRYTGILIIAVVYCGLGAPTVLGDWLWAAVLAGFLVLPDVTGFAIGGVRLDLKQAQNDIKTLQQKISVHVTATFSNDVMALGRAATQVATDQVSGAPVAWTQPGSGIQAGQEITS
jgi:hypothetical protein